MTLAKVTLILNVQDGTGANATQGTAYLAPSIELTDPADHVYVGLQPIPATFTAAGPPSVTLYATSNAALLPSGLWTWEITFENVPGNPPGWSFKLDAANGTTQYLSDLAAVEPGTSMAAYLQGAYPGNTTEFLRADGAWAATSSATSYTQPFTSASAVTVTHGLGKYPSVAVLDSAGDLCVGDIDYVSLNALTVSFSAPFSGTVVCN